MKKFKRKKWYVVKVDNNVVVKEFKGLCSRYSCVDKVGYLRWFDCWKVMRMYVLKEKDLNVNYCVMSKDEMWSFKNFIEG